MSRSTILTCDCGCKATTDDPKRSGWLILSQIGNKAHVKLSGRLHFKNLECTQKWITTALEVIPEMQASARGLFPRGNISSEKCPQIYI